MDENGANGDGVGSTSDPVRPNSGLWVAREEPVRRQSAVCLVFVERAPRGVLSEPVRRQDVHADAVALVAVSDALRVPGRGVWGGSRSGQQLAGGAPGAFVVRVEQIDRDDRGRGHAPAGLEGPVVVIDDPQPDVGPVRVGVEREAAAARLRPLAGVRWTRRSAARRAERTTARPAIPAIADRLAARARFGAGLFPAVPPERGERHAAWGTHRRRAAGLVPG